MPEALRDPAVGLSCDETPLYIPKTMSLNDIPTCQSCTLMFAAPIVGTKSLSTRFGNDGLNVDESPLTELTYNTNKYALFDTVIWKKGAHRNFKASDTYDLEMNLYFRDVFDPFKQIAMAIPITINDSNANPYFTEMADQNVSNRTKSLETIITSGPVIMYKGMDLRDRNSDKPYAAAQCQSPDTSLNWFILQPAFISSNDAKRIRSFSAVSNLLPPLPHHELTLERMRSMCSVVKNIELKSDVEKKTATKVNNNGIYLTRALQCQRINPTTDIKNDAVYLNGVPENTLQDELSDAADSKVPIDKKAQYGIRPKQIEDFLALFAGVALGIFLFSIAAYYILQFLYKGYIKNSSIFEHSILPIISEKQAACASFVTPIVLTGPAGTGLMPPDLAVVNNQLDCASAAISSL
jgi:hypothetical protein